MSGSDIPTSAILSGAVQRAEEKGDPITARELAAASCTAYEQEWEAVHNKAKAAPQCAGFGEEDHKNKTESGEGAVGKRKILPNF
jgi:hypothetical protein